MNGMLARDRLTLRLYMQLPRGSYLVSNVCNAPYHPVFAETVARA